MAVKARFYVSEVAKRATSNVLVTLQPVVRATNDNIQWSKYTPSGKIELSVTDENAAAWFEDHLGKDVAITFDDVAEIE